MALFQSFLSCFCIFPADTIKSSKCFIATVNNFPIKSDTQPDTILDEREFVFDPEMCCGEYNTAFYAFSWSGWGGVLSFLGTRTSFFSKHFQIQHFFIDFSIAEWMWKHMCVFPESCDHVRMIVFMCCAPMKSTTIIKFSSRMLYINFTDISVKPKTQNNALHNNEIPSY